MEKSSYTSKKKMRQKIKTALPPGMQTVKIVTNATILGKQIDITLKNNKATAGRIKKAKNAWNTLRQRLINKSNLKTRIKPYYGMHS